MKPKIKDKLNIKLHSSELYFIFIGMELIIVNKIEKLHFKRNILQKTRNLRTLLGYDYGQKVQIHRAKIIGFHKKKLCVCKTVKPEFKSY